MYGPNRNKRNTQTIVLISLAFFMSKPTLFSRNKLYSTNILDIIVLIFLLSFPTKYHMKKIIPNDFHICNVYMIVL